MHLSTVLNLLCLKNNICLICAKKLTFIHNEKLHVPFLFICFDVFETRNRIKSRKYTKDKQVLPIQKNRLITLLFILR